MDLKLGTVALPQVFVKCVDAPVRSATVYFVGGAEIRRTWTHQAKVGQLEIILQNVPGIIEANSLRVRISGTSPIVSQQVRLSPKKPRHVISDNGNASNDELNLTHLREDKVALASLLTKMARGKTQRRTWEQYLDTLGSKTATSVLPPFDETAALNLAAFLKTFETECKKIDKQLLDWEEQRKEIEEAIVEAENKLSATEKQLMQTEFITTLIVPKDSEITLTWIYNISSVSWAPSYNLRVDSRSVKRTMEVEYCAIVQQDSNEDWKNVLIKLEWSPVPNLTLRTPVRSAPKTPLRKTSLDNAKTNLSSGTFSSLVSGQSYSSHDLTNGKMNMFQKAPHKPPSSVSPASSIFDTPDDSCSSPECLQTNFEHFPVSYRISDYMTIKSGSEVNPTPALIMKFSLDVQINHYCFVNVSPHCYIQLISLNMSEHILFPGPAMTYLDGSFLGTMWLSLKTINSSEAFQLWLGVNPDIRVTLLPPCWLNRDKDSNNRFVTDNYQHSFQITNNSTQPVTVTALWDINKHKGNTVFVSCMANGPENTNTGKSRTIQNGLLTIDNRVEWCVQILPTKTHTATVDLKTNREPFIASLPLGIVPALRGIPNQGIDATADKSNGDNLSGSSRFHIDIPEDIYYSFEEVRKAKVDKLQLFPESPTASKQQYH